jgi:hypothetical protein
MKRYYLKKWKNLLGISDDIRFEYIPKEQVYCDYKVKYHMVGICGQTILHDRRIKEEDVLHELLHYKYPRYKESTIRRLTDEKMQEGQSRSKTCLKKD